MDNNAVTDKGKLLKQAIAIGCAALFLWLAFRGSNFAQVWEYAKNINPLFVIFVFSASVISHLLRAYRWLFFLEPLTERRLSFFNAFTAVVVGYAVNVVIPRGGEIARLISISKSEELHWTAVLPTMLIDRLIDIACLIFIFGLTLTVLPKQILGTMPWLLPGGLSLTITTIIGLVMLPNVPKILRWLTNLSWSKTHLSEQILELLNKLANDFTAGTKALTNARKYPAIILLSVLMWFCYWLNYYLMLFAFGLSDKVSVLTCLIVFAIGSVGVLVPTPGSVGSVHFLVSQALILTVGLNKDLALAYITVLHIVAFVLSSVIPAAICLAIQSAKTNRKIQATS